MHRDKLEIEQKLNPKEVALLEKKPINIEERLENVERILIHKFGTLNLELIVEEDAKFFKEANAKLNEINKGLDEIAVKQRRNDRLMEELKVASEERKAFTEKFLSDTSSSTIKEEKE